MISALSVPVSSFSSRSTAWRGVFAFVDAALRHLPAFDGLVDALADKDLALAVEQHHADAGPIRKIGGHGHFADGARILA